MKFYKRLTQYMQVGNKIVAIQPQRKERIQMYIDRLFELEDKIESGEICEREELIEHLMTAKDTSTLTDKEIEFFIKHNEEVRKETAREILSEIESYVKTVFKSDMPCTATLHDCVMSAKISALRKEYGVDLEDEE